MSTTTGTMTVAEFLELENPPGSYLELRHGEVVPLTRPKWGHVTLQERLHTLLKARAKELGVVLVEFPSRALPEYELRAADVAYARRERCHVNVDDHFAGAPDLVVEVLSPSNSADEIAEKTEICLENGTIEFWVVRPNASTVTVFTNQSRNVYKPGEIVPVDRFFPGQPAIPVTEIFVDG
jgi:Uma2 family endonuclease